MTPALSINGDPLDLTTERTVLDTVKEINAKYSTIKAPLTVSVSPNPPKAGQALLYTAKNMQYRDIMTSLSSTHLVECSGSNNVGSVRGNTLLLVSSSNEQQ